MNLTKIREFFMSPVARAGLAAGVAYAAIAWGGSKLVSLAGDMIQQLEDQRAELEELEQRYEMANAAYLSLQAKRRAESGIVGGTDGPSIETLERVAEGLRGDAEAPDET